MREKQSRESRMREATRKAIKDYLLDDVCDYDTIISAVAEMLWEDFGVKDAVADNLAKKLADPIWNDVVAEVEAEIEEARDWYRERNAALRDAQAGRW